MATTAIECIIEAAAVTNQVLLFPPPPPSSSYIACLLGLGLFCCCLQDQTPDLITLDYCIVIAIQIHFFDQGAANAICIPQIDQISLWGQIQRVSFTCLQERLLQQQGDTDTHHHYLSILLESSSKVIHCTSSICCMQIYLKIRQLQT